jgi:two-component system, chemotaxis family, protein-glutamate methylesterase/glutaminase
VHQSPESRGSIPVESLPSSELRRATATHDIIVIGASAGGVEVLTTLFRSLPAEFPASLFVVLHMLATGHSVLPQILGRIGELEVTAAKDGERPERGHAYVAPPDHHLMLIDGLVRVTHGPRENGHRPAVDPLFRSAARAFDGRVIGVVLSGSLDDGTAGLGFVKSRGGMAVVQDPNDAQYPAMPVNAIENVDVDHIARADQLGPLLGELVVADAGEAADATDEMARETETETDPAADDPDGMHLPNGAPSNIACPECGGVLWESQIGNRAHFRCQVGHSYSPDSLVLEHSRSLEAALWAAARSLEERAQLMRRIARRGRERPGMKQRYTARAEAADNQAEVLKEAITQLRSSGIEDDD